MIDLRRRRDVAQAVFDRFAGRPLAWGRDDCVRMAAFALRKFKRPVSLAKAGEYSSLKGALRALRRAGFDTLEAAVDAQGLERIAPAFALPGDIIGLPAEEDGPWLALTVALGNGRVLGFQGGACKVLQPRLDPETANRVRAWRATDGRAA